MQKKTALFILSAAAIVLLLFTYTNVFPSNKNDSLNAIELDNVKAITLKNNANKVSKSTLDNTEVIIHSESNVMLKQTIEHKEQFVKLSNQISLTKNNVPDPFFAFEKNTNLTWEDFLLILERFERYGSPIKYSRLTTDEIFAGTWWVEHYGYNQKGEPLFTITDLNSFHKESYALNEDIYDYDLIELNNDESLGEYDTKMENFALDALSSFNANAETAVCRLSKCMFKIRHSEQSDFNIVVFTNQIKTKMEANYSNRECNVTWSSLKPDGNAIYVTCTST